MFLGRSNQKYVSPSDTIMSPCTAKLNAYKSKHFMKLVLSGISLWGMVIVC